MNSQLNAPIRVGLIGTGGIAAAHIQGYRQHPDLIRVVAVSDTREDVVLRLAAETGAQAFTDFRDMIENGQIDAVDICLPHHLHAEAIIAAAEAGKHILCEKPLCLTPEEAARISEAVSRSGVTLMSAHNQLFMPTVAKAKEILDAGVLGQVYEVRTTDSFYNDFDPNNMGWRAKAATSGGGELIDTGYHPSYLLMYLAGSAPVGVAAMLSTHRLAFMEGEDSAQLLVRFENGVVGQLVTSWAYTPAEGTERFSVVGSEGSLTATANGLTYSVRNGETKHLTFDEVDTFSAEIKHFAEALLNGTTPIQDETDGINVLGIILAAYASAEKGTIEPVFSLARAESSLPV